MKIFTPASCAKPVSNFNASLQKLLTFVFILLTGLVSLNTIGQTTVTLSGEGTVVCPATSTAVYNTPPAGVSFSNLTRGSGVTCASASDGLSGSGFNTASAAASFAANKFYTVTITADATHNFTLSSITWLTTLSGTASGSAFTIQYKNNGGALTTFGTAGQTNTTTNTFTGSVTVSAGTSIVLYAIVSNASQAGGTVRFRNGSTFVVTAFAPSAPTVTTTTASSITSTTASSGGNVTSDGGNAVTARGVAYGLSPNPTTAGSITSDGIGSGVFVSTLSGLDVNTQYFYRAYATNSLGTSYGSESNFYTLANTPGTVTVNNPTTASLDVTLAGGDGNPASTEYAIQETGSGNYIQAGGALGASPVWQTAATWGTKTVTGLAVNANYSFHAKARNAINVETAFGGSASLYTLANTPGAPTVNNPTASSLDVTVTLNGNPGITQFAIQETTTGNYVQADGSLAALFVWQTASNWGTKTVTGLTASTLYTFQVKARNGNSVETGFGATQNGTTIAANQPDLTETSLASFGAVCINTISAANTFTINGTDLTTADVTVGPLAGFNFSTDDITYTSSLSISQPGGAFSQLIYVKFSPTSAISYDGNIPVGGGGALSDNVAASGSGLNTAPTVTTGAATNVTINSATIPGTITADGCSAITAYGAEYSITSGFANGTGIQFAGNNLNAGAFTVDISVLNSGTQYYYHTYATNGGGTSYSSQGTFTTLTPVLSTDPLTAFGPVCTNTTTTAHTFTITGTNLSTADVTVATLNGYSYSTDDISYFPSLTISQPGGAFSQFIYVRFSPTVVQSYNGNIVVGGGGAANSNVAASGSGINTAPSVNTGGSSAVTQTSATLNGTITNNGCTAISAYGIEYSTLNGFVNGTGTAVAGGALTLGAYSSPVGSLNPGVTYYYKAYATNDAGTSYGSQLSFTTPALDAPVATAATGNTGNSFTANWEAVAGASSYRLDVSTLSNFGTTITATDLFISEYVEGSATNKYLEIYNGTGASINLTDYKLRLYSNGSSTPVDLTLSGTLANGATIVYKNSAATIYGGTATVANTVINYNGDDAVVLFKISANAPVDIFGRIGEDPGVAWTGGGNATLDKTLVRKPTVTAGVTVNPAAGFPTLATEWTQSNVDVVTNLGTHSFNSFNPSFVTGYNNLTVNGLSQSVTGLAPNTTYYYRVRAFSATSTSANSNTITTQTLCATVTASPGANGTITPAGVSSYNCGDNAAFTITPNSCYSIADVVADGISQGPVGSYTFTAITPGAHTISATFVLSTNAITASTSGAGTGTISSPGVTNVNCGDNFTYTITAGSCSSIGDVLVDGVSVGAVTSYTFTNVTAPHTIEAIFILTPYTITVTQGANGSILPGTGTVNCGDDATYTITADACYSIADVVVDGVSQGAVASYTFTNVTANHTITASFAVTTYTITASSGPNGTVTPAGASIVNCGSNNVYTIAPAACYHVDDVLVDGVSQGPVTTYTFTNTQANHTISATFAINAALTAPTVTGPVNVCPYLGTGEQVTYTFNSPGATSYTYSIPSTNVTLVSSTANSITVTFATAFKFNGNKQIRVTGLSSCGNSPQTVFVLVAQAPGTPQPITGPTSVCPIIGTPATFTYTIPAVVGATSYIWTAQAGTTTITHPNGPGPNDTTVNISFTNGFTSSNLTVAAANDGCGASSLRSLALTKVNASTPGLIAGPTNVCPHIAPNGTPANYSVSAVAGQTYNWTVPAAAIGLTGQGTASISFTYPAGYTSGTISVTATNGCGTSAARTLNVAKLNPATPSGIDVIEAQPCPNRVYTYSVSTLPANAVSIQWTVPAAATGFTGQGTTTITVSYPATAVIGTVTATAVNNCGSSATRTVSVKLPACPDGPPPPPGPRTIAKGSSVVTATGAAEAMQVNVFPNPTVSDFKLQVITAGKEAIRVRILDMQGRGLKNITLMPYQAISIGSDLKPGSYMIELRQGTSVKTTKLIKF